MLSGERTRTAPRTWPDSYLEYWGEVYTAQPAIAARGVLFEVFLAHPVAVLVALNLPLPVPDLPPGVQRLLAALERAGACRSNGALIEKLRHTRIQRTRHRRRGEDGRLL